MNAFEADTDVDRKIADSTRKLGDLSARHAERANEAMRRLKITELLNANDSRDQAD